MLNKVNSFAPYLALAMIAYLTYSATTTSGLVVQQETDTPAIAVDALNPTLLDPVDAASPAGRDPFDVHWASYRTDIVPPKAPSAPTTQPSKATTQPTTQPAAPVAPKPKPVKRRRPAVPRNLMAIVGGDTGRLAIIDGNIQEVGSLVGGTDPQTCWRVEAIGVETVELSFGKHRATLTIPKLDRGGAITPSEEFQEFRHD